MSINNWPGGVINKTPVTPAGPYADGAASGVWTLEQATNYIKQGIWPLAGNYPTDPYFEYVTMLLHGDGTNGGQNNTFLDSSSNAFSITRNGNTTQGSYSPYWDLWSNYFDGTGNAYERFSDAGSVLDLPGDFTVEMWVFQPALATTNGTLNMFFSLDTLDRFQFYQDASNVIVGINGSNVVSSSTKANLNTWAHYAIVRSGSTVTLYLNGTSVGSGTSSYSIACTDMTIGGQDRRAGGQGSAYHGCNAYISNFRVVKGTAVYTGSFTPSTAPLTAISGTSLLTCQANRFMDASGNALAVTVGSGVRVTNFAPFSPSYPGYTTATNGGSGYFDGSGDYLTTAQSANLAIGTNDFCIEYWVYSLNTNEITPFGQWASGNADWILQYRTGPDQFRFYYNSSNDLSGNYTMVPNQWTHVAVCRSGSTMSLYVNGTRLATKTDTTSINNGRGLTIGVNPDGPIQQTNGYITDTRIVVGSSVYTPSSSTLTVPTAPLTAISNTKFLCGFTNGAIFDSSAKNDLETVGNAQISTSVKKFGTGSMYFDGVGDTLKILSTPDLAFGTGDFTVEFWLYSSNLTAQTAAIFANSVTNGFYVYVDGGSVVVRIFGVSTLITAGTLSNSSWIHVAVTRSGTSVRLFINGTQAGSTATSSQNFAQGTSYVGTEDGSTQAYTGYIDDLRITKGYARYTANFTPPTAAFPNI